MDKDVSCTLRTGISFPVFYRSMMDPNRKKPPVSVAFCTDSAMMRELLTSKSSLGSPSRRHVYSGFLLGLTEPHRRFMRAVGILPKKGWCCSSHYVCHASRNIVIKSQEKPFSKISSSMWLAWSSTKQSLSTLRQLSCPAEISFVAQREGQKTQFSFSFWFILFFLNGSLRRKCSGCNKLSTTFWIIQYETKFFTECYAISINSIFLKKGTVHHWEFTICDDWVQNEFW